MPVPTAKPSTTVAGLATWAMRPENSRGRRFREATHPYRSEYARDRDRIIHSRAFRRLEAKTQVFTTRYSDHFRNRLTHTIEVSQIARTVAAALGANAELAEALALVHDIGHPPFGHAGERKLNELMRPHGTSFNHNLHALRIVEHFEQRYLDFPGLNLTFEVREGIVKHSRDYAPEEFPELAEYLLESRPPLEAQLIDCVDEIAYNTADLDDAREAELLDPAVLCHEVPLFAEAYEAVTADYPAGGHTAWSNLEGTKFETLKFNEALKRVLNRLVTDLIETTAQRVQRAGAKTTDDIRRHPTRLAGFSEPLARGTGKLKRFLHANIYDHPAITQERDRSVQCLAELFELYLRSTGSMPAQYEELANATARHMVVCDYIAGMTDQFLLRQHREHFGE
ncbi:MAG TPA: deoxyguanosinetriphosphate triphosphohydrolase [Candidatus Dormibacteraeota bacterium]|nr:deoxyguanosinetriphosphate triphosphohydrolase [Candidatus Dormibacteraeota bacterium]